MGYDSCFESEGCNRRVKWPTFFVEFLRIPVAEHSIPAGSEIGYRTRNL